VKYLPLILVTPGVGLFATPANAEPRAGARASVSTKGTIWVGQRATVVIELLTPGYFASAAAFDLPPVSRAIVVPPEGRPLVGSETVDGVSHTTQRHELAVYAQRAGKVEVPAFTVRFESSPAFGKPNVEQRVMTPAVSFTAVLPPGAAGLATVITTPELRVKAVWDPQPGKDPVKPGAAFTRTITVEARDVAGMVLPAFRFEPPSGLRVYPQPPLVQDRTERGELTGKRVETLTYVCEQPGTFSLPALALAWWDPDQQKLKRVELPGQSFEVVAEPQPPAVSIPAAPKPRRTWIWVVGLVALLAGVASLFLAPHLRAWWERRRKVAAESESAYFQVFERACHTGDARATLQALLAWLDHFLVGDPAPGTERLAARAGDPRLTAELAALQDAVFGRPGVDKPQWSPSELQRLAKAARRRLVASKRPAYAGRNVLPPLNPVG
jgi:hypothetical protein